MRQQTFPKTTSRQSRECITIIILHYFPVSVKVQSGGESILKNNNKQTDDLSTIVKALKSYCSDFNDLFRCHRYDNSKTAFKYICGLITANKANMERMEERVVGSNYESYQQFISASPWSSRSLMDRTAMNAGKFFNNKNEVALIIDETAFEKKGNKSVGVARQWNGRLGKVDNSQVGVFASLSSGESTIPVDACLFLPKKWSENVELCKKYKIPNTMWDRGHLTKIDIAYDIIKRQAQLKVKFDYIVADGLYGNDVNFLNNLNDNGHSFMMYVHKDYKVTTNQDDKIRVDKISKSLEDKDWERVIVRNTTNGKLKLKINKRVIYFDNDKEWQLIIIQNMDYPNNVKYCITNADHKISTKVLAIRCSQRFWIERGFEDAKSHLGMAEYQIRGWKGWHHHIALVNLLMFFMTMYRRLKKHKYSLLSCYDISVLLFHFLPRKDSDFNEIIRQMKIRHHKRKMTIKLS